MKELFKYLRTQLKQVEGINWVDLDKGQVSKFAMRPAIAFPAALIKIDYPKTESLTKLKQQCDARVTVKVVFDYSEDTDSTVENIDDSLHYLDIVNDVYTKLQSQIDIRIFKKPLDRIACIEEVRNDGLKVVNMMFNTNLLDFSAYEFRNQLIVNAGKDRYVNNGNVHFYPKVTLSPGATIKRVFWECISSSYGGIPMFPNPNILESYLNLPVDFWATEGLVFEFRLTVEDSKGIIKTDEIKITWGYKPEVYIGEDFETSETTITLHASVRAAYERTITHTSWGASLDSYGAIIASPDELQTQISGLQPGRTYEFVLEVTDSENKRTDGVIKVKVVAPE